jgi:hypothetical protein
MIDKKLEWWFELDADLPEFELPEVMEETDFGDLL